MFTQVGVKQLTAFLRTVTAASDLVDCTLVNCVCNVLLFQMVLVYLQNAFARRFLMDTHNVILFSVKLLLAFYFWDIGNQYTSRLDAADTVC